VLAFALIAAACGDDDAADDTTTTAATTTTTTTTTTAAPETTTAAPEETTTAAPEETTTTIPEGALVIWADETRKEPVEAAAAKFTADTGIPVVYQFEGFGNLKDEINQKGPIGEGPDIFIGAHDWIGELVGNGVLEPIDLGAKSGEFYDIATASFTLDGNLYGLPYAIEALGLFRNTDLVPDEPATYADLVASCEGLAEDVTCLGVAAGDAYANQAFIKGFGGYIFGYDAGFDATDVGLDSAGAVEGATWLNDQVVAGVLDAAVGWDQQRDLFNQGKLAYMWDGPWQIPAVTDAGVNYATSAFPTIDGNDPAPFIGVQGFMINSFSENKLAAQTLLVDYLTDEQTMFDIYKAGGRGPAHQGAFALAVADLPIIEGFTPVEGDPSAAMPNIPEMGNVWGALGNAITVIYNQTYEGEVSDAAAAMASAATAVRDAIAG
jgi:maltose-binding protein MalE